LIALGLLGPLLPAIQLAHTLADRVEAAYRRGDLLEKRSRLMADWAAYCDDLKPRGLAKSIKDSTVVCQERRRALII
jgi:hypothetical protein